MRTETAEIIPLIRQQLPAAPREPKDRKNSAWKKKSNGRPGTPGYKWTPAQRKKFLATAARKQAARLKEERVERRQARLDRKAAEPVKSSEERIEDRLDASIARNTGRKGKAGPEERLDAIVYLARAYAAYEGLPDETLLGLLALRTLQGRIK